MMPIFCRTLGLLVLLTCPLPLVAQGTQADFDRAAKLGSRFAGKVTRDRVEPTWFENNTKFWYRNDLAGGKKEFVIVDVVKGTREVVLEENLPKKDAGDR